MTTAAPADQRRLLDVQAQESRLRALSRHKLEAQKDPELAASAAVVAQRTSEEHDAAALRAEADAAVAALTAQSVQVQARMKKDEAQLISGQSGANTLQGLQREIEALTLKQTELDDLEMEAMETAESAAAAHAAASAATAAATEAQDAVQARVLAKVAELDAELEQVRGQRAAAADGIPADLLALFETTLAKRGAGVARLFHGTSEGSGLALAAGDLAEIKRAPADLVVFCPDSGVILVRDPEWN